jgi:hypothetical protein
MLQNMKRRTAYVIPGMCPAFPFYFIIKLLDSCFFIDSKNNNKMLMILFCE